MAICDQAKRLQENPTHGEKKAVPLFTKGENLKRERVARRYGARMD